MTSAKPCYKGGSADLELLPFSPDRCVFLELSDITALQSLSVSVGDMSPAFERATYMYYVLLREAGEGGLHQSIMFSAQLKPPLPLCTTCKHSDCPPLRRRSSEAASVYPYNH